MATLEERRILVIAGSDSSGGAGLEADQKVITAHMCYAMTATTALTAQNTLGVHDIHHVPPEFVGKQIDACIEDIGVDVVKIGMLASAETINVVADALERHGKPPCVLDPVMVSTTGSQLLPDSAITTLINRLLPLTTILTPNIPEARLLLHHANLIHHMNPVSPREVTSSYDLVSLATSLQSLGSPHILIKGGHSPVDTAYNVAITPSSARWVQDILKTPDDLIFYTTDYSPHTNTHGTGCSLASAIACNLALSRTVPQACQNARLWIEAGIRSAPNLGRGRGPIDHFHSLEMKRQPPGGSTLDVQSLFAEPESERLKGVRGERRTRGRDRVFEEEMERMGGLGGGDGGDGGEGEGEGDGGRVGAEGGEAVEKEEVKGEEEEGEERYGKRRKVEDEV